MHGPRVAMLALGMLLVAPLGASAQTGMCADATAESSQSDVALELPEGEPSAAPAQDLLVSREELAAAKLAAAPADEQDLPWCTSQNDAKCSKRPAGSVPSSIAIDASPVLTLGALLALPSPSSIATDFAEYSCGGPRDAVRLKLERPPQ